MYLGNAKVNSIENETVLLEGWIELSMNAAAQKRLLTEEPDEKSDERVEKELAKKVLDVIAGHDIRLSLDKDTLEQNQTDVVASLVKLVDSEGYTLDEVSRAILDVSSYVRAVGNVLSNNLMRLQEDALVKALGLEKSGKTNGSGSGASPWTT